MPDPTNPADVPASWLSWGYRTAYERLRHQLPEDTVRLILGQTTPCDIIGHDVHCRVHDGTHYRPDPVPPKPPAYRAAVDRSIKNRRHTLVVDLAEKVHQFMRRLGTDDVVILEGKSDAWWRDLAVIAGHPSSDPSPETRTAVIGKVSAYLADDKAKRRP